MIITCFLVFVFIPVFSGMINKTYIRYLIYRYTEIVDMAQSAVVSELNTELLSTGHIEGNNDQILYDKILDLLSESLRKSDELIYLEVNVLPSYAYCSKGSTSEYFFLHVYVEYEICQKAFSSVRIPLYIHNDLEIPYDR